MEQKGYLGVNRRIAYYLNSEKQCWVSSLPYLEELRDMDIWFYLTLLNICYQIAIGDN